MQYNIETLSRKIEGGKNEERNIVQEQQNLPASYFTIESTYGVVFFFSKTTMFNVWSKIIQPPQAATFATPPQACTCTYTYINNSMIKSFIHFLKDSPKIKSNTSNNYFNCNLPKRMKYTL